jgi:uncharacterized protein (TIGR02996 family)
MRREPALGPGVFVSRDDERATYRFLNGGERSFKHAYCQIYIKPTVVSDEIRDKLLPPSPATKAAQARAVRAKTPLPRTKPPAPKATDDTFEAQILERPDEPGPYLVYADWLLGRQDPRGELITIQSQRAEAPDNEQLAKAEKALLKNHGEYFVPEALGRVLDVPRRSGPRVEVVWRNGFFAHLRLARDATEAAKAVKLDVVARAALAHPSARFLRSLSLGPLGTRAYVYTSIVAAIAKRPIPSLAELRIGDFTPMEGDFTTARAGEITPLFAAAPALEKLTIRAGDFTIAGPLYHTKLRELTLVTTQLAEPDATALVDAVLPALETLIVQSSRITFTTAQLLRLRGAFPKLRRLVLPNTVGTGALVRALIGSALLAHLEELDLSGGDLDDKTASEMMGEREQFERLRTLSVGGSKKLSPDWAARLAKATGARTERPRLAITEEDVAHRSPDQASMIAARKIAVASEWMTLGFDPRRERVWGEYEGRDHYYVYAELRDRAVGCGCGSPKSPCKHALALLLLAANQHAFPDAPMPDVVGRTASPWRPRYTREYE